ncbi:MAG TPA: DUF58 domain-containing protein [Candidatus Cybelea sp.]|nr:DUF58 domain-containing protein [Candidatus Cybelea sp.]
MTASNIVARLWRGRDRPGWRNFGIAMLVLSFALAVALLSAAAAQEGRVALAAITTVIALGLAGWVGITIVPALARRTSLRWIVYQVDYRLTREGVVYLVAVLILVLAAVNTGNNLLFMILACALAGILISGVLSRAMLTSIELKFDLPEHIFAGRPVIAEIELRNDKQIWPSFSLRVIGENKKNREQILVTPVFFPYIPRLSSLRQKVELSFPHRGVYRQDAFGIRTGFPFGLFEKTRRVDSSVEILAYPCVEPADQFYEVLPLLSGEMASFFRGRGHELYSLRSYQSTDSVRFVDWKTTAKTSELMVREFAREDERRVMIVFDPFTGGSSASAEDGQTKNAAQFERAVSLAASIAWHFHEINSVIQFCTDRFSTPMAPASEIIYDALRELARIEPASGAVGGAFLDELVSQREIFKIILTARSQHTIPTALWTSSYIVFIDAL